MQHYAPPSDNSEASWFDQSFWKAWESLTKTIKPTPPVSVVPSTSHVITPTSVLPTPSSRASSQPATISESVLPTSLPCPGTNCLFTGKSSGAVQHLLFDGIHFHGFIHSQGGPTYWAQYKKNGSLISLRPCCEVYSFEDIGVDGVVVDAVINEEYQFYVGYHFSGQQDYQIATFELPDAALPELKSTHTLSAPPISLFFYEDSLYVVTKNEVYREGNPGNPAFSTNDGEIIRDARILEDILYLLLKGDEGMQVKAFNLTSEDFDTDFNTISVSSDDILTVVLQTGNQRVHLLEKVGNKIHWLKYSQKGVKEDEHIASLPNKIKLTNLMLIFQPLPGTENLYGSIIAMGSNDKVLPWWSSLPLDDMPSSDSALSSGDIVGISLGSASLGALTVAGITTLICYLRYRRGSFYSYTLVDH